MTVVSGMPEHDPYAPELWEPKPIIPPGFVLDPSRIGRWCAFETPRFQLTARDEHYQDITESISDSMRACLGGLAGFKDFDVSLKFINIKSEASNPHGRTGYIRGIIELIPDREHPLTIKQDPRPEFIAYGCPQDNAEVFVCTPSSWDEKRILEYAANFNRSANCNLDGPVGECVFLYHLRSTPCEDRKDCTHHAIGTKPPKQTT